MIAETIPELQNLSSQDKLILAGELCEELCDESGSETPDPAIVQILEERWQDYLKNPEKVFTWDQIKTRLLEKHGIDRNRLD